MAQSSSNGNRTEKAINRPAHTIRYGAVRAAIWRNMVDNGNVSRPLYGVTFSRSFKDDDNNWKDSASFGPDDLLLVAKIADEAHSWIARQKSADANASNWRGGYPERYCDMCILSSRWQRGTIMQMRDVDEADLGSG